MQEELATLNVSHSTLLAQLNTITKEMQDLKRTNTTLKEENEGWEFLLRERTLSGRMKSTFSMREEFVDEGKSQLEALDEEMEMDELNSDLEAQSPILEDGHDHGFVRDLDDHQPSDVNGALSRSPESVHLKPSSRRRKVKAENSAGVLDGGIGTDLAAELDRAETDGDASAGDPRTDNESEGRCY